MKRLLSGLLAALLLLGLCAGCKEPAPTTNSVPPGTTTVPPVTTPPVDYTNSTVVLYTANIRGDLQVYSQIASARAHYEALGSTVLLVDAGNYLQGSAYTGTDMGLAVYNLMDAVGYDVAGMGIYDFAYGGAITGAAEHGDLTHYYTQAELYRGTEAMTYQKNQAWAEQPVYATRPPKAAATFRVVCSSLQMEMEEGGAYAFASSAVLGEKLRVGFQSQLPANALDWIYEDDLQGYSSCEVTAPDCDILVSMGAGEGDIVIDVPADGSLAVGAYVIDNTSKRITFEEVTLSRTNEAVDAWIAALPLKPVIGTLDEDLNGTHRESWNGQTPLGTLVADALKWYAETKLEAAEYPVIGLFNGGNCIGSLYGGEITELDIRNAIHGSKAGVGIVHLTGNQLLQLLEAATQRENCPGWAQISGIEYVVDTARAYDFGAAYGPYYKANSVNRVTVITEGFDPAATYAVVADVALLAGSETYYLLHELDVVMKDPAGADVCQILIQYIQEALGGHITVPAAEEGPTVTVTLDANGGSCQMSTVTVWEGGRYGSLPVAVRDGYVFLGWFTAKEGGEQITGAMPVTVTALYAQWAPQTGYTVSFDANGGRLSSYHSTRDLEKGDLYGTLPQPQREGYSFLGWYTDPEKGTRVRSTTKFTLAEDQVLYAHWEYDAVAHWRNVLDSTVQRIPYCRRVVVYNEMNADSKTYVESPFLEDAGAINAAADLKWQVEGLKHSSTGYLFHKVTDEWISSTQPYLFVKLTTSTSMAQVSYIAMQRRFPDAQIYVFSTSAVDGTDAYQLYCRLYLAKLLYPEYFEDVDLDAVKAELKVKATIFHE